MSEEPDFGADCGKDSLDNCMAQIEKADYYLLLIGARAGTVFEADGKQTSVTYEEFKHYVKQVRAGKKLNLIAFVRKQAWESYTKSDTAQIHPLQMELIKDLLENTLFEDLKVGRWRYTFDKFSDIISVLETNQNGLFLDATRKSGIYRMYVKREVSEIAKALLEKKEDKGTVRALVEVVDLPKLEHLDILTPTKIDKKIAVHIAVFCTIISSKDSLLRKINRVFTYVAQGEFSRFDAAEERYVLPEYIKSTIQTLEILEKIFDNARNSDVYIGLRKRNTDDFRITEMEYWIVYSAYRDLKIATTKLANLIKCLHLDWHDFEKKPDSFYEYRGRAGENISDSELLKFADDFLKK